MIKLSVITINYNDKTGLQRTLDSVRMQDTREFQYIVIDGGSTDGSIELIKEYKDIIDYWISEKDHGIYEAMNKGVAKAIGTYCNFLNSGDTLYNSKVVSTFNGLNFKEDIQIGASRHVDCINGEILEKRVFYPLSYVPTDILFTHSIGHGPAFIKTELLRQFPYDETLRIVSDWKFYIEALVFHNASYRPLDFIVDNFDCNGCSNKQLDKMMAERDAVLKSYFPEKLITDYMSMIQGRTELERIIKSSQPNGVFIKFMTLIAKFLINITKVIRK